MTTAPEEIPTLEHPAVGAPDLETRQAANLASNVDDIFSDETTDNSAARETDAKTEGVKETVKVEVVPPARSAAGDLTEALNKLREAVVPAPVVEKPTELTQAQIDEALGNIDIKPEDLAALNDPEKQGATLKRLLSAAGLHGLKMSKVLFEAQIAPLQGQIQELIQERQVRVAQELETKFFSDYKSLNTAEHKAIVALVGKELVNDETYKKATFSERAKLLAEKSAEYIKSVVPTFVLTPSGTTAVKPKTTTIPRQATGATTGTGGGSSAPVEDAHPSDANVSTGTDVFD